MLKTVKTCMITTRRILTTNMILCYMPLDEQIRCLIVSFHASSIFDRTVFDYLIEQRIMPFLRFITRYGTIQYRAVRYRTAIKYFLNRFILMHHDLNLFILMYQWHIIDASISPTSIMHRWFGHRITDASIIFRKINDTSIINPRINYASIFFARINDASIS